MNHNYIVDILARLQQGIPEHVEEVMRCDVQDSNIINPPETFEVNIALHPDKNNYLEGAGDYDGFGEYNKAPPVNQIERALTLDLFKRGKNMIAALNVAGKIQAWIETDEELHSMVDYIRYEGSVPNSADGQKMQFTSIAMVIVLGYSTERGAPQRRIHSK